MTKWTAGPQYGSFDPGNVETQIVEDLSKGEELKRRVGGLFNHPLNRALMVLVVFASMGLLLIIADHTTVPAQQQGSSVSRAAQGNHYGCLAEVGLTGSQLQLYQIDAPWQLLMKEQLDVPMDVSAALKERQGSSELSHDVVAAFSKHLRAAQAFAQDSVMFGAVRVKDEVGALAPGVRRAVESAVASAMEKSGIKLCNDWDRGGCIDKQNIVNWDMLKRLDKDVQSWFSKAVANINTWRESAKEHAEKVAKEAKDIKERAKESLEKEGREAKKKYEAAKEAVGEATRRFRQEKHGSKHSTREAEKAERKLEKELRHAEDEYEYITRRAEKEYDKLERHAEDLLQKAEKEMDHIDQKADAKLHRLQEKMNSLCKAKKCLPQVPPAAPPTTPATPPPAPAPAPAAVPLPPPTLDVPSEEEVPSAPTTKPKPKTKKNGSVKAEDGASPKAEEKDAKKAKESEPTKADEIETTKAEESASTANDEDSVAAQLVAKKVGQRQHKGVNTQKLKPKPAQVQEQEHDDVPHEIQEEVDHDDEPKPIRVAKRTTQQRFDDELQRSYLGDFAKLNVRHVSE